MTVPDGQVKAAQSLRAVRSRTTSAYRRIEPVCGSPRNRSSGWLFCENRGVQKYAVVIHKDPEGGFWAEVPALPGCYSQGESVDELKHNIREAITGALEVLREQGREPDSNIQILDVAV